MELFCATAASRRRISWTPDRCLACLSAVSAWCKKLAKRNGLELQHAGGDHQLLWSLRVSRFAQALRRFWYIVLAMPKSFLPSNGRFASKPTPKLSALRTCEFRSLPAASVAAPRITPCTGTVMELPDRLCLECEQPIPAKRLAAVPQTRYCVDCAPHWHEPYIATISDDDSGCYNIVLGTRDPTSLEDAVLHRRYTP